MGWVGREYKRRFDDAFEEEMRSRDRPCPRGPRTVAERLEQQRPREPRFGFMAEDEGLRGLQLWRRGWVGKQWHYEYMSPGLRNHSGSNMFADFRKDFRIPIPMFDSLVEQLRVERLPWAPDEKHPKPGSPPIPLALKVMSALRVLALGVPFSAFNSQGLSESVVRVFFFHFVRWMKTTRRDSCSPGPGTGPPRRGTPSASPSRRVTEITEVVRG